MTSSLIRDSSVWWTPAKYRDEYDSLGFHAKEEFRRSHATGWRGSIGSQLLLDGREVARYDSYGRVWIDHKSVSMPANKEAIEKVVVRMFRDELIELGALEKVAA